MGKAVRGRDAVWPRSRCSSASLNDNLFDIGFLEEFAAYCVQTGSAQLSGIQPLHVRSIHMESAPNLDHFANQFNRSSRGVDPHYAD